MKRTRNKAKDKQYDNSFEKLLHIGEGVASSVTSIGTHVADSENWNEILGFADSKEKQKRHSGDLQEGQELNLKDLQEEKQEKRDVEPGINYSGEIVHAAERAINHENREMDSQLREIMAEIKKLADSSKELQMRFKGVAVEQHAVTPGKYHKNFFSWLLNVIRTARMQVEDSGAWLEAMHSKRKSRGYGEMAKKQGTSFTLNNERTVATQVG